MESYKTTIGLEVHAELKTLTKMFCSCKNDPDETKPNYNICPVCTAQPGALPVINKHAVREVLRVGTAVGVQVGSIVGVSVGFAVGITVGAVGLSVGTAVGVTVGTAVGV